MNLYVTFGWQVTEQGELCLKRASFSDSNESSETMHTNDHLNYM